MPPNPPTGSRVFARMSTTRTADPYRWDAQQAAADYDAAAPVVHPLYNEVQAAVLAALPVGVSHVVDLGGGSGRLAEQILGAFPQAAVTVVEPSKSFRTLATRRLSRFGDRATIVPGRAEEAWSGAVRPAEAIVSTSALHHLDADQKNAAFATAFGALPAGGVMINGDEYRPPSDATYRELLIEWGEHMRSSLAAGLIPDTFGGIIDRWEARNLDDFGGPRTSGDDCHETTEEQIARLYGAGFSRVEKTWHSRLWGVLVAQR